MTDRPCAFCEALQLNKNIRVFYNDLRKKEGNERIYEEYTVHWSSVPTQKAKSAPQDAQQTTEIRALDIS